MQQEQKSFLDKNSDRMLARVSGEEVFAVKNAIAAVTDEIAAAADAAAKNELLNLRFGALENTILHLAAKFGDEENIKKLLALAGSDQYVDVRNDDGFTPLHFAACGGHLAAMQALLAGGADKNAQAAEKKRRWTPIHYAAQFGHVAVIEALIKAGVDKEIKTGFGLTPLVVAAEFGHANAVQYLLSIHAEKNVQTIADNHKMTALHYAVIGNFADVAVILLDAKIDKEKETTFGLTALEFAAKNNLVEMVLLLLAYGADKWDDALKIAQENNNEDAVVQIKKYQKAKARLFTASGLEDASTALMGAVKQYNATNLGELKIDLADGVVFNAYGILSLKHQVGLFKKVNKTFLEFMDENGMAELASGMKKLSTMTGTGTGLYKA